MAIEIRLKTYTCPDCDYKQDFDPSDAALMAKHFPGVEAGNCPACNVGQNPTKTIKTVKMAKEMRQDRKCVSILLEDTEIEALEVDYKDATGLVKKMKLSNTEKTQIKAQRDLRLAYLRTLEDK